MQSDMSPVLKHMKDRRMDATRTQQIAQVLKNVKTLGKNVKQPGGLAPVVPKALLEASSRLPVTEEGWTWTNIAFYVIAGILVVGLVLLVVDQFVTPIFKRGPGGAGVIDLPGNDITTLYWPKLTEVRDLTVSNPTSKTSATSVTSIIDQTEYSFSVDVYIDNEYPQDLPTDVGGQRIFFFFGPMLGQGKIQLSIDNNKNTLYANFTNGSGSKTQTLMIDNVPIRKPFRVGVVKANQYVELYLNGKLVQTKPLGMVMSAPGTGYKFFAPASIVSQQKNTAVGIRTLNLRIFPYAAPASEMLYRMSDLTAKADFLEQ